jgi:hypothetical protein
VFRKLNPDEASPLTGCGSDTASTAPALDKKLNPDTELSGASSTGSVALELKKENPEACSETPSSVASRSALPLVAKKLNPLDISVVVGVSSSYPNPGE